MNTVLSICIDQPLTAVCVCVIGYTSNNDRLLIDVLALTVINSVSVNN